MTKSKFPNGEQPTDVITFDDAMPYDVSNARQCK